MVKTRKIVYTKQFSGLPRKSNFAILEEDLPPIKNEELLLETKYISIDIVIRYNAISNLKIGDRIWGIQLAKILESKNTTFSVGKYIVGYYPISTYFISDGLFRNKYNIPWYFVDEEYHLSKFLGIFGSSMVTAYYGLTQFCKANAGETLVVTTAAGGVGHLAGQIGKILGCRVIGLTSKSEKCLWLKGLGFDHVINYVTDDVSKELAKLAPNGIDCFFDNVGGEMSIKIMENMNTLGRVAICGSISLYCSDFPPKLPSMHPMILTKQLSVIGFLPPMHQDKWLSIIEKAKQWFEEGKLKTRETIVEGFDNYPNALELVCNGENLGKTIIKI